MEEPYLGQIEIFPFNFSPKGWMLCNGQILPIQANKELFDVIGSTYGGNGTDTFALPNLRGTEPMPCMMFYIAVEGARPSKG